MNSVAPLTAVSRRTGKRGRAVRLTDKAECFRIVDADIPEGCTGISNDLLHDIPGSFRALGILALLYTYPPGHLHAIADLIGDAREGRDAVLARLGELSEAGLVETANWRIKRPVPPALRMAVLRRDGYRCVICDADNDLMADHVIPESAGGPATFENLQTMCRSCNSSKGSRVLH